jgi:hypothetical protein
MARQPASNEAGRSAGLFAFALVVHGATTLMSAASLNLPLAHLGVYFDGHMYLEIARSFPLPYSAEGIAYTGFAPGYPALIYLTRLLVPAALASWGSLALLATVIPAALAAVVFYRLCRELELAALWPSIAFVVANSRWLSVAGTAHPEPLATCLALLCFLAHLRGRTGVAVVCLALAGLTRFPALLLGVPLAYDLLIRQRRRDLSTLAWLSVPPLAFALFVAYLHIRIPGYPGLAEAHRIFWDTHITWPFAALTHGFDRRFWGTLYPHFELTYAWAGIYLLSLALGLRPAERPRWFLVLWVASIVLFHTSLSGMIGAMDFQRLVLLAWPAALLIHWRAWGRRLPEAATALALAGLLALNGWATLRSITAGVMLQAPRQPFLARAIGRLNSDSPHWVVFYEVGDGANAR